ncbi:SufE family protein [Okibacterium endophyticum]
MTTSALPSELGEIRDEFLAVDERSRLQLLLEFSRELADLPPRYSEHPDLLERVAECQAPVYLFIEIDDAGRVHMHATAPEEAPTTRGFASILAQGVDGLTVEELINVPNDFPQMLGLTRAVSPLRLNGMSGMLQRAKRQAIERSAAPNP